MDRSDLEPINGMLEGVPRLPQLLSASPFLDMVPDWGSISCRGRERGRKEVVATARAHGPALGKRGFPRSIGSRARPRATASEGRKKSPSTVEIGKISPSLLSGPLKGRLRQGLRRYKEFLLPPHRGRVIRKNVSWSTMIVSSMHESNQPFVSQLTCSGTSLPFTS